MQVETSNLYEMNEQLKYKMNQLSSVFEGCLLPLSALVSNVYSRMPNKEFKRLAKAAGLKRNTIDKLIEEDFDSVDTVKNMKRKHIDHLELSVGQQCKLEEWVESLQSEGNCSVT